MANETEPAKGDDEPEKDPEPLEDLRISSLKTCDSTAAGLSAADAQSANQPAAGPPDDGPPGAGQNKKILEPFLIEGHGAELVIESRNWYLGQNQKLFKVLFLLTVLLLFSFFLNGWQIVFRPEPRYFAVTHDLRILEMPPLSEPVVESRSLSNWAGDVLVRALSLNFLTWRQTLSDLRSDFEPAGFESFIESLKSGGHLEKIEKERLSLSALISGAPVVTKSFVRDGVMNWHMEMPLVLSYESSTGVVASQKLLAEMVIQRTQTSLNPRGVVIRQIVLSKAG
jgi:intracellular multiplication protein IcmL